MQKKGKESRGPLSLSFDHASHVLPLSEWITLGCCEPIVYRTNGSLHPWDRDGNVSASLGPLRATYRRLLCLSFAPAIRYSPTRGVAGKTERSVRLRPEKLHVPNAMGSNTCAFSFPHTPTTRCHTRFSFRFRQRSRTKGGAKRKRTKEDPEILLPPSVRSHLGEPRRENTSPHDGFSLPSHQVPPNRTSNSLPKERARI